MYQNNKESQMEKKILLFYKYVKIENPEAIKKWQSDLCQRLNLQGRIILAHEGINGTLCGTSKETDAYKDAMDEHPLFNNIDFKESLVDGSFDYFERLRIVIKDEVVHLGIKDEAINAENGGLHLTPQQAHHLMENASEDLLIFDARNLYESRIGTFKNALLAQIDNFRDLPEYIDQNLEQFQDKEVLMFCTGGIRCERASAYLKVKNVAKKVYQIEGGIHRYVEQFPDGFFRGKNYVFDNRVAVKVTDDVLGNCDICNISCDVYTNCLNATCNKHFIGCKNCIEKFGNTCGEACFILISTNQATKRPFPRYIKS